MTRIFDIIFSAISLLMLSPLFIILAIWIKFDSSGPILYRQKRVGKNGKEFSMFKFRSMYEEADKKGLLLTVGENDSRITRVGFFLRKYKFDELPQFLNVLLGQMSIVGPRPEVKKYVDLYTKEQRAILNIRPGITDIASVKYKDENELLKNQKNPEKYYIEHIMPEKIRLNYVFLQAPDAANYFSIIFLTFKKLFISKN
jgi:lipopolysaccharide/colanic/teichoic acid biosynthesis glycosyltransferase